MRHVVEGIVKDDGVGLTLGFLTATTLIAFGYRVANLERGSASDEEAVDEQKHELILRILESVEMPDERQAFYSQQLAKLDTETLIRLLWEMGNPP